MDTLTPADIVNTIANLGTERVYEYVSGRSSLRITHIEKPEGPIRFVNVNADGTEGRSSNVSRQSIATMAAICSSRPNYPLHVDRVFSAGGNTRSAFETMLAHTPRFFMCYPLRIDVYSGEEKRNLKHIMWCPNDTHPLGEITDKETDAVISEVELGTSYGQITITPESLTEEFDDIDAKRTHTQMQIALIEIGNALNFETWIARNDRSIQVGDSRLGDLNGVIPSLSEIDILYKSEIEDAATFIDCIWFADNRDRIPAVIEVEHSTGVTSGLTRMLKLRRTFPAIQTEFTIVAPDTLRNKVIQEANDKAFKDLRARFMPYSTVRELYGLIQRYSLSGVVDYRFVEPFMQIIVD